VRGGILERDMDVKSKVHGYDKSSNTTATTAIWMLVSGHLLDAGELFVSRSSLGRRKQGERYLLYLPTSRNYLWRQLHDLQIKVRVFLEPQLPEKLDIKDVQRRRECL
jgi:hypothetical protein